MSLTTEQPVVMTNESELSEQSEQSELSDSSLTLVPDNIESPKKSPAEVPSTINHDFTLNVPGYQEDTVDPRFIPLLVGRGGFHIRNIVKFSTKQWYGKQDSDNDSKCPQVKIQFQGEKADPSDKSAIKVSLSSVDQFMISTCERLINDHSLKLGQQMKLGLTPDGGHPAGGPGPIHRPKKPVQFQPKTMQIFRVEMESRFIGKIIGKKGIHNQTMVKFVADQDADEENAKKTKIFVREQEKEFKKGMCIDLKELNDGSGEYVIFMATVFTRNSYFTMRNVENAIRNRLENLHNSYSFDEDLSQKIEEKEEKEETLNEKMYQEALEEEFDGDGGW